jgi:four helix bundle protein
MTENKLKFQPTGLRNLRAYQLAKQLSHRIYDLTAGFPNSEFRLIGQMRGSAVSVIGNIAEGYGRNAIGDYIRFCEIARGSLAEMGSYLEFCQERHYLKPDDENELFNQYNHTWNTLGALIKSLKDKKFEGSWDDSYKTVKEELTTYDF